MGSEMCIRDSAAPVRAVHARGRSANAYGGLDGVGVVDRRCGRRGASRYRAGGEPAGTHVLHGVPAPRRSAAIVSGGPIVNPTPGADTAHRSTTAPVSTASTSSGSSDESMTANAPGSSRLDALRSPGAAQAMRFAMVGIASTVLYTVLFAVLDTRMNHQIANILALLICTVLNTWVNQRFTFDAVSYTHLTLPTKRIV